MDCYEVIGIHEAGSAQELIQGVKIVLIDEVSGIQGVPFPTILNDE